MSTNRKQYGAVQSVHGEENKNMHVTPSVSDSGSGQLQLCALCFRDTYIERERESERERG